MNKTLIDKELDSMELEEEQKMKNNEEDKICPLLLIASHFSPFCKKDKCQMWDETIEDCGLKNNQLAGGIDFKTKDEPKTFNSFLEKGGENNDWKIYKSMG